MIRSVLRARGFPTTIQEDDARALRSFFELTPREAVRHAAELGLAADETLTGADIGEANGVRTARRARVSRRRRRMCKRRAAKALAVSAAALRESSAVERERVYARLREVSARSMLAVAVLGTYYGRRGGKLRVLWRFTEAGERMLKRQVSPERQPRLLAQANESSEELLDFAHVVWNMVASRELGMPRERGNVERGASLEKQYSLPAARRRIGYLGRDRFKAMLRRKEELEGAKLILERPTKTGLVRRVVGQWTLWTTFPEAFSSELLDLWKVLTMAEAAMHVRALGIVELHVAPGHERLIRGGGLPREFDALRGKGRALTEQELLGP